MSSKFDFERARLEKEKTLVALPPGLPGCPQAARLPKWRQPRSGESRTASRLYSATGKKLEQESPSRLFRKTSSLWHNFGADRNFFFENSSSGKCRVSAKENLATRNFGLANVLIEKSFYSNFGYICHVFTDRHLIHFNRYLRGKIYFSENGI